LPASASKLPALSRNKTGGEIVFSMSNVTLRIGRRRILPQTSWTIRTGENWVIIGPNGAGKTTLLHAVIGRVPVVSGKLSRPHPSAVPGAIGYVSFDMEQRVIDRERARDEARYFSGKSGDRLRAGDIVFGTRPGDSASAWPGDDRLAPLGLDALLNRDLRHLSTGELRRVFIGRARVRCRGLLVLDEPFEGLDARHARRVADMLDKMMLQDVQLILVTHHIETLPERINRAMVINNGRVTALGSRTEILTSRSLATIYGPVIHGPVDPLPAARQPAAETLIDVRNATVRHGSRIVFENLCWQVRANEHWAISGPNGAGKTTLLRLVTGDHLQAYANEIYLFGRRRGSGESIWDIKKRFGVVSTELQRRYRLRILARNVVRSGFFDSIGLYRSCTPSQRAGADQWIMRLNLTALMSRRYDQLSVGERKLVLIARAMVKSPAVLILDEPCQGLDPANRRRVLALVDRIGQTTGTRIIFVSHRPDEIPACITHRLRLPAGNAV